MQGNELLIPALCVLEDEGLATDLKWNVIFVSSAEDAEIIDELAAKELKWKKVDLNRKYPQASFGDALANPLNRRSQLCIR